MQAIFESFVLKIKLFCVMLTWLKIIFNRKLKKITFNLEKR